MTERILIIDDEPYILITLEEILRQEGYQTESAQSGKAALEKLRHRSYDLAIIDQRLPDMAGLDILAEIQRTRPSAAAILLTGHASLDAAIEALRRGASDYLLKPCHPEELRWSVKQALDRKRVSETAQFQKKMELLYQVGRTIAGETRLDVFLKTLVEKLCEVLEASRGFILLAAEDEEALVLEASNIPFDRPLRLPFKKETALYDALMEGKEVAVADPKKDRRLPPLLRRLPLQSLLIVPMILRGKFLGILSVDSGRARYDFTESDIKLTRFLADQAAVGIENIRSREHLRRLSLKVLSAQEDERKRISHELHDATGQALLALKLHLEMLAEQIPSEMKSQREEISEAHAIAIQAIEEIRRLVADLRPPKLDDLGLLPTLRGVIKDFSRKFRIETRLKKVKLYRRLPSDLETALYRIFQEALTNAAKHAKATEISISLERVEHRVIATIADNGIGFDPAALSRKRGRRFGLAGIQERVDLMGGSFKIVSRKGKGTELRVELPIPAAARKPERAPVLHPM